MTEGAGTKDHKMKPIMFLFFIFLVNTPAWANGQKNYIIFDGDFIVSGFPSNAHAMQPNFTFPDGTDFPSDTMWQLNDPSWIGFNMAISTRELATTPADKHGYPRTTQIDDFDARIAPTIKRAKMAGATRIIVFNGGEPGNMLYFCGLNQGAGGTVAQNAAYAALKAYAIKVHKAGASFVDITMTPESTRESYDRNLMSDIDAVNQRIRQHCINDGICDAVSVNPSPLGDRDATFRLCKMQRLEVTRSGTASITSCGLRNTGLQCWAAMLGKGLANCYGRLPEPMR